MLLSEGDILKTLSGRDTSPFPKVSFETERKTKNTVKRVNKWLMQNALDEAVARGDDFNECWLKYSLKNPSQADKDCAEMYLFG